MDLKALEVLFVQAKAARDIGQLALFAACATALGEEARRLILAQMQLREEKQHREREPVLFNLKAHEAARLTGMSERWLYEHAHELPYAKRQGKRSWRFSREMIERLAGTR